MIGNHGRKHHCKIWWALWLSSKNRFYSPLIQNLETLLGFEQSNNTNSIRKNIGHIIKYFAHVSKMMVEWGFSKIILFKKVKQHRLKYNNKSVYLIKTFAYDHCFQNRYFNDLFFGKLPDYLESNKFNRLTIYSPIRCNFKSIYKSKKIENVFPYLVFVSFLDFFKVFWEIIVSYFKIAKHETVHFQKRDISNSFNKQLLSDLFDFNTYYTLLIYRSFKRICLNFQVENFIYPFENYPWEKMCILALREESPNVFIRGYQHTVVPLACLNMFPSVGEVQFTPFPDTVLTVGSEVVKILSNYGHYHPIPVRSSCAIRFEYLQKLEPKLESSVQKKILLALEGVYEASEVVLYLLEESKKIQDWDIVIRTHPAMPLHSMNKLQDLSLKNYPNVKLSNNLQLIDDLLDAGVVMYWGSSVSLEAAKMGLPLINYEQKSLLIYDPLFLFEELKWTVDERSDLRQTLNKILSLGPSELKSKKEQASVYIDNYFHKVTNDTMLHFVQR